MTLIIDENDGKELVSVEECISIMEDVFIEFGGGKGVNRPRLRYSCPTAEPGINYFANIHAGALPKYGIAALRLNSRLARESVIGTKRVEFPNPTQRYWGHFLLYSLETAELLGIIVDGTISPLRVAATTAVAAKVLARPDSDVLALFGTGHQARLHAKALAHVFPFKEVRVYSPTPQHRVNFASQFTEELGILVRSVDTPSAAVKGASIICCATNSSEPVFDGRDLGDGQLVTSIVNSDAVFQRAEVDRVTFTKSSLVVVNDRESIHANRQRELLDLIDEGILSWKRVVELGEVLNNSSKKWREHGDVIYYKNNSGMAIQFAAMGKVMLEKAKAQGVGKEIPGNWFSADLAEWYAKGYFPAS
jgi:ornithine cyclodeaminase